MMGLEVVAVAQAVAGPTELLEQGRQARRAGNAEGAIPPLEAAARLSPTDADILLELGLAYYATERLADAERVLARAQGLAPDYRDVTLARARVALAQGRTTEARRLAGSLAAQGDDEARLLIAQAEANPQAQIERLDLWTTRSTVENQDDWTGFGVGIGGRFAPAWSGWANVEHTRRFGRTDVYGEVGIEHGMGDLSVFASVGGAPDADYRAELSMATGARYELNTAGLAAVGDVRFSRYPVGEIWTVRPGLLWEAARWGGEARWIRLRDETGTDRNGWMVSGQVALVGVTTWMDVSASDAPETSDGFTVDVRAWGVGVRQHLSQTLNLRLAYVHEDRGPFGNRDEVALSLTRRF
ncbi:MAG: YaiO family outer membrane beta-barrel protein [Caulobacterales bacterium]|nr:YaiO family outer membrane beta-barrel protein [Caulobacterales bacterium]